MHQGLTSTAKHIVNFLSQTEAKKCKANEVQPEHIMLAILREGSGTACRILRVLNIDTDAMRNSLVKKVASKRNGVAIGNIGYAARGKRVLEDAIEEAKMMSHEYVGTEHLLLACAHELDSVTARYLFKNNISISILRDMILKTQSQATEKSRVIVNRERVYSGIRRLSQQERDLRPSAQDKRRTPVLDEFSADLTKEARDHTIDPVIGREREIKRVVQVLVRRNKNNPILIGEPGVGKTAIVEGLAHLVASGKAPLPLSDKRVLSLDLPAVVAGTKYRGEFEERLKRLMKEAQSDKNIILFIDEIHMLIGAGGAEGAIDAANIFKPTLSRGDIQCIGATTTSEYKKCIERDTALERRFQSILVEEPSVDETLEILHGVKEHYEKYHRVKYSKKAIHAAVHYAQRYISDRFLPDKAIDVIDEAGARHQIGNVAPPKIITELQDEIGKLNTEKVAYVNAQNYERAAFLRDEIGKLEQELAEEKGKWQTHSDGKTHHISETEIMEVVSDIGRVPVTQLVKGEMERLVSMEDMLNRRVIGQQEAVDIVAATIRKSKVGLHSPHKPIGSFLFLGPTGVGKTLLAKELALFMFGAQTALIRVDMSDYMEKHTVSRLVGAPPGYVGFQEGGELTEKVRRKPYSIILFDEIEKAHKDFFNILLQVLEEGELQDNSGITVSFRNAIIIMTSNAGTSAHPANGSVGFTQDGSDVRYEALKERTLREVKNQFRPEFLNRIDTSVVFKPLESESLAVIFDLLFRETCDRLAERDIELRIEEAAKDVIVDLAQRDGHSGARPLRRLISTHIEEPLSHGMISGLYKSGHIYRLCKKDDDIVIEHHDEVKQKKSIADATLVAEGSRLADGDQPKDVTAAASTDSESIVPSSS